MKKEVYNIEYDILYRRIAETVFRTEIKLYKEIKEYIKNIDKSYKKGLIKMDKYLQSQIEVREMTLTKLEGIKNENKS